MKNIKSILEGISSQGKMMGSRGSSFRDSSSSSDQTSGLSIGASRAKDHEDATKDASIASEKARKNEIKDRNREAEQRQKETMQMSQEEAVTEAKMTKKFVFDKPNKSVLSTYSKLSTEHLQNMHDRWVESHKRDLGMPKRAQGHDQQTSDGLLAADDLLKKRGVKVQELPEHPNLGMVHHQYTDTKKREEIEKVARMGSAKSTSPKSILPITGEIKTKIVEEKPTMSLPNFGLSASLIAAARQIVEKKDDVKLTGGNTPVKTSPETKDHIDDDEDTSTSKNKKKLDPVGDEDDDVDNDGDVDKSDSYLKNRRKAIGKAIKEDRYSAGTAYWTKHPDGPRSVNVSPSKTSGSAIIHYIETDKPGTKSKEVPTSELRHPDNMSKPFVMKENEQLDEISKNMAARYVVGAERDLKSTKSSSNFARGMSKKPGDKWDSEASWLNKHAQKRRAGIAKAADKLTKEDFTSDELARIDEIAQSIFEIGTDGINPNGKQKGMGDVTNAVLSDEKKPSMDDDQHKHPMQQLEKIAHSVEGREPSFEHKDGSKTKVGKTLARQLKSVHDSMKTTQEKNKFADSVHASRDSMRAAADKHL
jgi:hypothetical protein